MKAIILAGGKGTRLIPYTTVFPKPMLPVGDKPILEIIIRQLAYYGFKEIILCVSHLAQLIQAYFQNCHSLLEGVSLTYVKEEKPLGTAGPIALIPNLKETFLVMNGDVLTTLDYLKLLAFHKEKGALLTVAMHKKEVKINLGIIEASNDYQITKYTEKPQLSYFNSMGIYIYEPEVIRYIEPGVYLDLPTLVLKLIENGDKVFGYYHDKPHYWLDIGQHEDYQKANEEFEKRRTEFLPEGRY
jgi:NDP-sugar pyrophosphorylase family protein